MAQLKLEMNKSVEILHWCMIEFEEGMNKRMKREIEKEYVMSLTQFWISKYGRKNNRGVVIL